MDNRILAAGLLPLIVSVLFYLFPPKRINSIYGFRTDASMQNQDSWNFAQKAASKYLLLFTSIVMVIDLALYFFRIKGALKVSVALAIISLVLGAIIAQVKLSKFNKSNGY